MASARQGQIETHIDATPETVWSLMADLDRMGEWSPECYRVTWLDGASNPAKVGARFKGKNRWGPVRWSMTCEVKTSDPGREISWSTIQGARELVTWRYRFEPQGAGTKAIESFEVHSLPPLARFFEDVVMVNRDKQREAAMRATLQRIKAAAETPIGSAGPVRWPAAGAGGFDGATTAEQDEPRVVSATREIAATPERIFELIADPTNQPRWDGNDNLAEYAAGQRVRAVGDVFAMVLTHDGAVRENHVVDFEEGRRIAWRPAEPGQAPPGHQWSWSLEPLGPSSTRITHTYDWSDLTDEHRFQRARATTAHSLRASLDRLADLAEQG